MEGENELKHLMKWLCLLLASVMTFALAGCGGSAPKEAPKENGKTVVTFWHVYTKNFGAPVIKQMVDDFNKSQDKILVKEVYNPDMYPGLMKNLQADVASGKAPSIAMIGYNYLDYFNENFQYVSPEELAKKDTKDPDYLSKTFLPNVLGLAKTGDTQVVRRCSSTIRIFSPQQDLIRRRLRRPGRKYRIMPERFTMQPENMASICRNTRITGQRRAS